MRNSSLYLAFFCAMQSAAEAADFDCVIEPRQIIELRTASPGIIVSIRANRGEKVVAGSVLVEIDPALDRAAADIAEQRAKMLGALKTAQARLEYSEAKATRQTSLAQSNFISVQERDSAIAEKKLAQAELEEAQDNKKLANLELDRLREQVRLRTILSPIDGVVIDRYMHPGEYAGIGEAAKPILKLADMNVLHVEVLLPINGWNRVQIGQNAEVTPGIPGARTIQAKVVAIDQVFDAPSGTFGVRLALRNAGEKLPAGIRCKARFPDIDLPKK
jgi:RND family efflux transporter MFP subunit